VSEELRAHTVGLTECGGRLAVAGGKAVGLARLMGFGFSVPDGFVVTTRAYLESVSSSGIADQIERLIADETLDAVGRSDRIQALFSPATLSSDVAAAITADYERLCGDRGDVPVAVRSSATAEDLADASFAGQQDTYLWVEGADAVLSKVSACWASLFTARALSYRARLDGVADLAMAVVVQEMVDAEAAGVMMTLDPVTGDRSTIYIESAPGLGESIVRGEVDPDRFSVDRKSLTVRSSVTGHKETMWKPSSEHGESIRVDVPAALRDAPSLSNEEAVALAEIGRRIDNAFDAPMDVEWAVSQAADGSRTFWILQARPETVWSNRATPAADDASSLDDWDPLDSWSDDRLHWTTSNLGEACPGVLTPLSWSIWAPVVEGSAREAAYAIGALTRAERQVPEVVTERFIRIFKGRPAMQLEYMAMLGDRMPGTTGEKTISGLFGHVPEGLTFAPTRRRYLAVAWRLPYSFITIPRRIHRLANETNKWWLEELDELEYAPVDRAVEILIEARVRLRHAVDTQSILNLASIQVTWDALRGLIAKAGIGDEAVLSGFGGPEMDVVHDLSKVAHDRMGVAEFMQRHGFHGPMEGELSSVVWREDPSPVLRLLDGYRTKGLIDPAEQARQKAAELGAMQEQVLAALPRSGRLGARLVLRLAERRLTQRGIPKRAFLQALDVTRAAARRIGALMAEAGALTDAEDVFYLTCEQLTARGRHTDLKSIIFARRERRAEYSARTYPSDWMGRPQPVTPRTYDGDDRVIEGLGVSSGVIEGAVRIVMDPSAADVNPGEILVAPTTDPSWCSLMYVSSALVVDIGGALSHAAVVARELGIPCVVNTRTSTQQLATGDRIRVDGVLGTVEVLARATAGAASGVVS
jgi:pyruvate,water dikinase